MLTEPLSPPEARKLILKIVAEGSVQFSQHALDEMEKDRMIIADCLRVLRGGWVEPAEFENGSWRHQVRTQSACVVNAFYAEEELFVVTAWRVQ